MITRPVKQTRRRGLLVSAVVLTSMLGSGARLPLPARAVAPRSVAGLPTIAQRPLLPASTPTQPTPADRARIDNAYGKLPISFTANHGQTDPRVDFISRGSGYTLFLAGGEAVLTLRAPQAVSNSSVRTDLPGRPKVELKLAPAPQETDTARAAVVRLTPLGSNIKPSVGGEAELPGKANYFIGNDPAKWRTNVPTYEKVRYTEVYRGIDLVYYGNQRQLEYDFIVAPGADPKAIRLGVEGAETIEIDRQGDLVLHTAAGDVRQHRPIIYQDVDGQRVEIAGGYLLANATETELRVSGLPDNGRRTTDDVVLSNVVTFHVADYDHSLPLVIDPTLVYSTFLGGTDGFVGQGDRGHGIAVDSSGNAYVTGETNASDFPTTSGTLDTTFNGIGFFPEPDAFVTKVNAAGTALLYSTFLGGVNRDIGFGVAVDSGGQAYVTGFTYSSDFPTTPGAFDTSINGDADAFVVKLNAAGTAMVYSSYLGGVTSDIGFGIAVDIGGNAYVTGQTPSPNFPTTAGAFDTSFNDCCSANDGFITKLNPLGTALVYSTFLGGTINERANAIAVDTAGNAYVTGVTGSADFPVTIGAFQTTGIGFVTKINVTGSGLVYSTRLGDAEGFGIAVDVVGNAYVGGGTFSPDFPTTPGAFDTSHSGPCCTQSDTFVTKLNPLGTALVYSTFLGGFGQDQARGIGIDAAGSAHVTGFTTSPDFPTTPDAVDATFSGAGGSSDVFVTKVNTTGSALVYSTFLGASGGNVGEAIAVDGTGAAYVTGITLAPGFPTTPGAFQPSKSGFIDAFIAKFSFGPIITNVATNPIVLYPGDRRMVGVVLSVVATDSSGPFSCSILSVSFNTPQQGAGPDYLITAPLALNLRAERPTTSASRTYTIAVQCTNSGGASSTANVEVSVGLPLGRSFAALGGPDVLLVPACEMCAWTATSRANWITITSGASGVGGGRVSYTVAPNTSAASRTGTLIIGGQAITITQAGVGSLPIGLPTGAPFGSVDTPTNGATGVTGSIAVTGWALDDTEVTRVRIYRAPVAGEATSSQIFLGDAVLVPGARPDIANSYKTAPFANRAGWGYLLLTNMLPNWGNGTFTLSVYADDREGQTTLLGTRTITGANASATRPFGAIDTPAQGETISGKAYVNFGWALTPLPKAISADGSTIQVYIDGALVGPVTYNTYRADIASLFPGLANTIGASAYRVIDTTKYANGLHTISWAVTDSAGVSEGIGSRYFTIQNDVTSAVAQGFSPATGSPEGLRYDLRDERLGHEIRVRRGYDASRGFEPLARGDDRAFLVRSDPLDCIELDLGVGAAMVSALPIGSTFDTERGMFTWQPGPGFLGEHEFVFAHSNRRVVVRVTIEPRDRQR